MPQEDLESTIRDALEQLVRPRDEWWHSLVDIGARALPYVINEYSRTAALDKRVALVALVSEYRSPDGFAFLLRTLSENDADLWKGALDGLVTLGGSQVKDSLADALAGASIEKREWISEAIEQISRDEQAKRYEG